MKLSKFPLYFFSALTAGVAFSSCSDDDHHHQPAQEQELITTLKLIVVNRADTTEIKEIVFRDLDGEGGQNGTITPDTLRLKPDAQYTARLEVLDESDPQNVEDIGAEIEAEANVHQFFFSSHNGLGMAYVDLDLDQNGLPLGLNLTIGTPPFPEKGTMRISLSHFGETPKNGSTPSGDTDIEVNFPVSVE